jgi:hypothetical protein
MAYGKHRLAAAKLLALACLTLAAGCGGEDGPNLGEVTGTVTLDGQPLVGATIDFRPIDPELSSYDGQTDEKGRYVLHATADRQGAEFGEYTVHVTMPKYAADDPRAANAVKIPAKYNTRTELKAEIKDGENEFDFELTSR